MPNRPISRDFVAGDYRRLDLPFFYRHAETIAASSANYHRPPGSAFSAARTINSGVTGKIGFI